MVIPLTLKVLRFANHPPLKDHALTGRNYGSCPRGAMLLTVLNLTQGVKRDGSF